VPGPLAVRGERGTGRRCHQALGPHLAGKARWTDTAGGGEGTMRLNFVSPARGEVDDGVARLARAIGP